jgi:PTH1 family peptidyl-tRNA hydrolase
MKVIVGLGNPDFKYHHTRHNFGWLALDALADKYQLEWEFNKKFKAYITQTTDLLLVKPATYMNSSGLAVQAAMHYYKLIPTKLFGKIKDADLTTVLTVIHDDLDLDLGKHKVSTNSGSAGHKGVQSIIDQLKTKKFTRIRLGIHTNEVGKIPSDKFVLMKFSNEELLIVNEKIQEIIKEI